MKIENDNAIMEITENGIIISQKETSPFDSSEIKTRSFSSTDGHNLFINDNGHIDGEQVVINGKPLTELIRLFEGRLDALADHVDGISASVTTKADFWTVNNLTKTVADNSGAISTLTAKAEAEEALKKAQWYHYKDSGEDHDEHK